ncbi:MAG: prefoldin subunit alpha [Candidatus Anstonellaceae archaeon]
MPEENEEKNMTNVQKSQESLERLVARGEILENQARAINEQLDRINAMIIEINRTIETIDNLKNLKNHGLLPIGSGVYITCKNIEEDLFVGIGGDFIVKKNRTETKKLLEQKIKELNKIMEDGQKKLVLINSMIDDVNKKAAELSERMKNV